MIRVPDRATDLIVFSLAKISHIGFSSVLCNLFQVKIRVQTTRNLFQPTIDNIVQIICAPWQLFVVSFLVVIPACLQSVSCVEFVHSNASILALCSALLQCFHTLLIPSDHIISYLLLSSSLLSPTICTALYPFSIVVFVCSIIQNIFVTLPSLSLRLLFWSW